jgi:hypothetical protein
MNREDCHGELRQIRNPKADNRRKAEARNPKAWLARLPNLFGLRLSGFFRTSDFGLRISPALTSRIQENNAPLFAAHGAVSG